MLNIGVQQLLAPFETIFCASSLCQDISSASFPIKSEEVGEYVARDLRPFLRTEPLQILHISRSTLVDSPLQVFCGVQVRGLGWSGQDLDVVVSKPFLC